MTKLKQQPYMHKESLMSCKGSNLHCALGIFRKMSNDTYKWIIDAYSGKKMKCLQPCSDNIYDMKTTTSAYPAKETFQYSKEACMLILKFFEKCKYFKE